MVLLSGRLLAVGPGLSNDLLGDYHGTPPLHILPQQGLEAYTAAHSINLTVLKGCDVNSNDTSGIEPAAAAASHPARGTTAGCAARLAA